MYRRIHGFNVSSIIYYISALLKTGNVLITLKRKDCLLCLKKRLTKSTLIKNT